MANKQFNVRQIQKHDTEANWDLTDGFIPLDGELIVYDKDATHDKPRIKIGDGVTNVKNLPFSGTETDARRDFTFTCTAQSGVDENTVIGTLAITDAQIKDCFDKGIKIHGVGNVSFSIDVPTGGGTYDSLSVLLDDIIFTPYLYVDTDEDEHWHLVSTPFCTENSSTGNLFIFVAEYDAGSLIYNVTIKSYRGLDGKDGADGEPGEPGEPGEQGEPGTDGADGTPGLLPLELQINLSTFDITGVRYSGSSFTFLDIITALNELGVVSIPTLYFKLYNNLACYTLENMHVSIGGDFVGKIIFRCDSVNKSGLLDAVNQLVPNKFPSNTTDLDIIWSREYDSDNDTYVESLIWSPITGGVTTISMSATSAQTFAAALGGFIQAATSTPNVPTKYVYTSGTIDEYQDVMDALNAGKTVWLNNNGMKQSIVNYSYNDGFTVHVYIPQYDIGQGVNIIASVDIFVTNSRMILYGYSQTI